MKLTVCRLSDDLCITTHAKTDSLTEAIERVYHRHFHISGTPRDYVATHEPIAHEYHKVRMGYWEPRANATRLGDTLTVHVLRRDED